MTIQTTTRARSSFGPQLFDFLTELAANNNRDWFGANKQRYEEALLEPALDFVSDFAPRPSSTTPRFNQARRCSMSVAATA